VPFQCRFAIASATLLAMVAPVIAAAQPFGSPTLSTWAKHANAICAPYVRAQHTAINLTPRQEAALERLRRGKGRQAGDATLLKGVAAQIDHSAGINDRMRDALMALQPQRAAAERVALALSLILRGVNMEAAGAAAIRRGSPGFTVDLSGALDLYGQSNAIFVQLGATECAK